MRTSILILVLILPLGLEICGRRIMNAVNPTALDPTMQELKPSPSFADLVTKVDFATQIKPILEARCQPCHFQGGKMYQRLPFDQPETIRTLGEKLFTRIKEEKEQRLLREFLTQERTPDAVISWPKKKRNPGKRPASNQMQ